MQWLSKIDLPVRLVSKRNRRDGWTVRRSLKLEIGVEKEDGGGGPDHHHHIKAKR